VSTSHGPYSKSYQPTGQASRHTATASAPLSAEGLRAAISSAAGAPAVLQRGVSGRGATLVVLEGTATLSDHGGRPTEAQRAKPALPGAGPRTETAGAGSS
jgi:hypothetical protein